MANEEYGLNESLATSSGCNRVNVRNGMKMVIEDRLNKANEIISEKPIEELINYIHFEYQNGFTVCVSVYSQVIIDGETYSGTRGLYIIRDEGQVLFVIYRERGTRKWKLHYDEFDLLRDDEKTFYMMIDSILSESQVESI